jgi:hypothetical protein
LVGAGLEVWEVTGLGSLLEEVYFGLMEDSGDA